MKQLLKNTLLSSLSLLVIACGSGTGKSSDATGPVELPSAGNPEEQKNPGQNQPEQKPQDQQPVQIQPQEPVQTSPGSPLPPTQQTVTPVPPPVLSVPTEVPDAPQLCADPETVLVAGQTVVSVHTGGINDSRAVTLSELLSVKGRVENIIKAFGAEGISVCRFHKIYVSREPFADGFFGLRSRKENGKLVADITVTADENSIEDLFLRQRATYLQIPSIELLGRSGAERGVLGRLMREVYDRVQVLAGPMAYYQLPERIVLVGKHEGYLKSRVENQGGKWTAYISHEDMDSRDLENLVENILLAGNFKFSDFNYEMCGARDQLEEQTCSYPARQSMGPQIGQAAEIRSRFSTALSHISLRGLSGLLPKIDGIVISSDPILAGQDAYLRRDSAGKLIAVVTVDASEESIENMLISTYPR